MINIDLEKRLGLSVSGDIINLLEEYSQVTSLIYAIMINENQKNRKLFDDRVRQAKIDAMKIDKNMLKRARIVKSKNPKNLTLEELNEIVKNSSRKGNF